MIIYYIKGRRSGYFFINFLREKNTITTYQNRWSQWFSIGYISRTVIEQGYKLNSLNQGSIPSLLHNTLLILTENTFFFPEIFPILQLPKDPYVFCNWPRFPILKKFKCGSVHFTDIFLPEYYKLFWYFHQPSFIFSCSTLKMSNQKAGSFFAINSKTIEAQLKWSM